MVAWGKAVNFILDYILTNRSTKFLHYDKCDERSCFDFGERRSFEIGRISTENQITSYGIDSPLGNH